MDGNLRNTTSGKQTFETPSLEPGKSFYYVFKAEVVREGKTRSEDKRVVVEAGKEVNVAFGDLVETVSAKR